MSILIDAIVGLLVFCGSFLLFAAGLGLLRGPNPFVRLQPVAKAGSIGATLLLLVAAIASGDLAVFLRALVAAVLILLNAALMSQVLAEAAARNRRHAELSLPSEDKDQNQSEIIN